MTSSIGRVVGLALCLAATAGCGPKVECSCVAPLDDMAGPTGCSDIDGDHFNVDEHCPNGFPGGDCDDNDRLVYPGATEICGDHKVQDCSAKVAGVAVPDATCDDDRDGYAVIANGMLLGGDCNDANPFINPGAYEITQNDKGGPQGIDDNCDGRTDEETPSCDTMLKGEGATTFANGIEVCAPWLQNATFNKLVDGKQKRLTDHFGVSWHKLAGETMAYFSTGVAADEKQPGFTPVQPGAIFQGVENNPLQIWSTNVCTMKPQQSSMLVNDLVALTLVIRAPTNARGIEFDFNFFSAEYPEYVGKLYNDMFVVKHASKALGRRGSPCRDDQGCSANHFCAPAADPKDDGTCTPNRLVPPEGSCANDSDCEPEFKCDLQAGGLCTGNIAFDAKQQPITVNSAELFTVCMSSPICMNGGHTCSALGNLLDGTGYEVFDETGVPSGGATNWLRTTAPVVPGELFTITFVLFDDGDHQWDSAVLLDGFHWLFEETSIITIP